MAHQDVTNVVKIEMQFAGQNNNAENVLHARYNPPLTLADLDALNTTIQTWLNDSTYWSGLASQEWQAIQVVLTDLNSLSGPRRVYPIEPAIVGRNTSGAIPANATIAVKADTGTRGRGKNGRVFWVGVPQEFVDGSNLNVSYGNNLVTALTALGTAVGTTTIFAGLCIPHLTVNHGHPNPAGNSLVLGFAITDYTMDSQRDRLPFHKRHKRTP